MAAVAAVPGVARGVEEFLAKKCSAGELSRRLKQLAPEGTTEGSLYVPAASALLPVLQ